MPAPPIYPLDLSGNSLENKILDELHSVTGSRYRDYSFIVPNCAPFYVDNLSVTHTYNGITRPLTEDVEYSLALPYITGTRTTGKPMYGALTINDLTLNGILSITYQTLGGDQIPDRLYVLNYLVEKAYNPRTTVWDIITNVPNALPPTPHYQDYDEFYGQEEVVNKLNAIKDAILANSSNTASLLANFFTDINPSSGNYVNKLGDTMTGPLVLPADPTLALQATTKQYVDAADSGLNTRLVSAEASIDTLETDPTTKTYVDAQDALKVAKAGGTMTGALILSADPTVAMQAVTKQYVDAVDGGLNTRLVSAEASIDTLETDPTTKTYVDAQDALKVAKAGDTMTGFLTLSADPTNNMHAATKQYTDTRVPLAGGTMTGFLTLSGAPTANNHAATKTYVDAADSALASRVTATESTIGSLNSDPTTKTYVDSQAALKVAKSGDTMTGALSLSGAPTVGAHATTKTYVDAADALKLALAGGTLTGALTLSGAPTVTLHAATKGYVDTMVPLAGGTMTGLLTLSGAPTAVNHAATKAYVDSVNTTLTTHASNDALHLTAGQNTFLDAVTATSTEVNYLSGVTSAVQTQINAKLALAGGTMTGFVTLSADPTAAMHAATKQYVDNAVQGLNVKASVRVATTANLTLTAPGAAIDGVTLAAGNRVLVKNQTAPAENGIYIFNGAALAMTRSSDVNVWTEIPAAFAFIEEGTTNKDTGWVCTSDATGTLGTTAVTWTQFAGSGYVTAGTGITVSGGQVSLAALANSGTGTFLKITIDSYGRISGSAAVTAADIPALDASKITTGTIAAARLPAFTGDATTVAGATAITLANSGVTAGTYNNSATAVTPVTVDAKGRVTATGAAVTVTPTWGSVTDKPTTLAGYGITDAAPSSHASDATVHITATQNTWIDAITATAAQVNYLVGTTSAVQTQLNAKLALAGGTMTGLLTLSGAPTANLHAATKTYVDTADSALNTRLTTAEGTVATLNSDAVTKTYVNTQDALKLPLTGGTLTGALTLSGAPTVALHAATKAYVDTMVPLAGGTMTGLLTLSGAPTAANHAATKTYVDVINTALDTRLDAAEATIATLNTSPVTKTYVDAADALKLPLAGGTMTGLVTLSGVPTATGHAATKGYVDTAVGLKLNLAGGTLTGALTLSGAPTVALHAATKGYVDTMVPLAGGTMTGLLTLSGVPTAVGHAATKAYVDSVGAAQVTKAGDTMTGLLTLSGAPTLALHAATKGYVDTVGAAQVTKAGDTMTGPLVLSADPTLAMQAATKQYIDAELDKISIYQQVMYMNLKY